MLDFSQVDSRFVFDVVDEYFAEFSECANSGECTHSVPISCAVIAEVGIDVITRLEIEIERAEVFGIGK